MTDRLRVICNLADFNAYIDDIDGAIGKAARPASQAAAQVLYTAVLSNVSRIGRKTGNLAASIYQVYSKDHSIKNQKAVYHISWNARKAPHGHLVEYGHKQKYLTVIANSGPRKGQWITIKSRPITPKQVAAQPFIRPATDRFPQAQDAAEKVLLQLVYEVTQ